METPLIASYQVSWTKWTIPKKNNDNCIRGKISSFYNQKKKKVIKYLVLHTSEIYVAWVRICWNEKISEKLVSTRSLFYDEFNSGVALSDDGNSCELL